jgi:hypothetical protein
MSVAPVGPTGFGLAEPGLFRPSTTTGPIALSNGDHQEHHKRLVGSPLL